MTVQTGRGRTREARLPEQRPEFSQNLREPWRTQRIREEENQIAGGPLRATGCDQNVLGQPGSILLSRLEDEWDWPEWALRPGQHRVRRFVSENSTLGQDSLETRPDECGAGPAANQAASDLHDASTSGFCRQNQATGDLSRAPPPELPLDAICQFLGSQL
jgi:hypothetical protein